MLGSVQSRTAPGSSSTRQLRFTHADGVWQPDPAHHVPSVVGGPHGGRRVRILIQSAFEGTDEVHERLVADTLAHEPSTAAWNSAWAQSDLHSQHHALVELWASPQHYDAQLGAAALLRRRRPTQRGPVRGPGERQ